MRKYHKQNTPKYTTKGIQENIPLILESEMFNLIRLKEQEGYELDYLQVFEIEIKDDETIFLKHLQESYNEDGTENESNMFNETRVFIGRKEVEFLRENKMDNEAIFVIDDTEHITMLLSSEY